MSRWHPVIHSFWRQLGYSLGSDIPVDYSWWFLFDFHRWGLLWFYFRGELHIPRLGFYYASTLLGNYMTLVALYYLSTPSRLIMLGQSRRNGCMRYYPFYQVSECDTLYISYDNILVSQLFSGWNILWVSNDLSRLIIDRVNEKLISNYTPFLGILYSYIYNEV